MRLVLEWRLPHFEVFNWEHVCERKLVAKLIFWAMIFVLFR